MHKALTLSEKWERKGGTKKPTLDLFYLSSTKSLRLKPMDSWNEQSNMTYKYIQSKKMSSWWVAQKYDLFKSQSFKLSPFLQLLTCT